MIALLDSSGSAVARYEYGAWGDIRSITDGSGVAVASSTHIANINPLRYRGYYYDAETGFYYLQSRYYDPVIKRFINADAAEYSALSALSLYDTNLFAYCRNNPVMYKDDDGEWVHLVVGAVVGGVLGGVSSAITQTVNGGQVAISTATGAVGGVLAASGVGIAGQVAGSAFLAAGGSALSQARDVTAHGKEWSWSKFAVDTAIGAISGLIGGKGASYGNSKSIATSGRNLIKQLDTGKSFTAAYAYYAKTAHNSKGEFVIPALRSGLRKTTIFASACNLVPSLVVGFYF